MSKYKLYSEQRLNDHLAQFLINSWSYSKAGTFARNPKAFEMEYVYGYRSKSSASTVAGHAYHAALQAYFESLKSKNEFVPGLVELTNVAFTYIEDLKPSTWKLQKTNPTVEECVISCNKTTSTLIEHFLSEKGIYLDDVAEILDVEVYGTEFVTLNGIDIPLPLNFRIDLALKLKNGKVVIVDHKSKGQYTGEEAIKMTGGKQAMTYVLGYESMKGITVDEVWFMENKYSKNKDKSPQIIKFTIDVSDINKRRHYEFMLYEAVRGLITAVNDPDYVYIMNDSDNLVDMAEMYQFWTKTLINDVEDFNIDPSKKTLIEKRLKKIKDSGIKTIDHKVIREFQKNAAAFIQYDYTNSDMTKEEKIQHALRTFGIIVEVAKVFNGYSSDTFLLSVNAGTKISSIQSRKLELANALDVSSVRVSPNLRVWEKKSYVAIEVSKEREKDLLFNPEDLKELKIPIGRNNLDEVIYWDLNNHSTPHALVCGSTGSGKSVSLRSTIEYAKLAGIKNIVILDPKHEFKQMKIDGVMIYSDIEDIELAMQELVDEMNERVVSGGTNKILVIFDEFADAQAQARSGKELDVYEEQEVGFYKQSTKDIIAGLPPQPKYQRVHVRTDKSLEENLRILLQKGRSTGFRIVAATQRASSKIITGDAKANFPVQICYRVPKEIDSRVVIDEAGAESLAGRGDGLIKSPEYPETERFQAYYFNS